ncbi:MAG: amidohydrolase family protein [Cyclobacteriaceae bacterium]
MKHLKFSIFWCLSLLIGCQTTQENTVSEALQENFDKIDIHAHYRFSRDSLIPLFDQWKMKAVLVDVAHADTVQREIGWQAYVDHQLSQPDHFFLCSAFEGSQIEDPQFASKIIERFKREIANGARMVKVWKNFGMVTKDSAGNFIQINDPRLQPIWDYLTDAEIPVMAHIAEPIQAWRELEDGNPHYNYYKNNPQYHAYQHPEIPSWETIIDARDQWLEANPNLTVLGAHMGSMSHDVDLVAERLDRYPNLVVETAARFGDITGQDSEKVRAFFIKYQDRILYGTDLGTSQPQEELSTEEVQQFYQRLDKTFAIHWQYFSGGDSLYFDDPMPSFPVQTVSLNLPDSVLRKFYYENALSLLGAN